MDTGIFATFSKKVISTIIALGSMFYSTIDGVTPTMPPPILQYKNDNILVSATIENCYTDELEQIFSTGNEIRLDFSIGLLQVGQNSPDSTITFFHTLRYSPIENTFSIFFSERNETVSILDIEQAKRLFPAIANHAIFPIDIIAENANYYLEIKAWLNKIKLEGIEEELNLLFYWNSIKPSIKSAVFTKHDFLR